jgi:hypothetical protein
LEYQFSRKGYDKTLENQFIYPIPKGSKLILASPSSPRKRGSVLRSPACRQAGLGAGVNEENQFMFIYDYGYSDFLYLIK